MKLLLLATLLSWYALLPAQTTLLTGSVADSSGAGLPGASLLLLRPADSVLTGFATADAAGRFTVKKVPPGQYVLKCNALGYATAYRAVAVEGTQKTQDLGVLTMTPHAVLGEVEISAELIPIRIKKDTIEYNAAAFKTQPGAVVEDLLKRLPGVEVDDDGTVRAQGEEVRQVLVDGKEFFGDDPQIATKNLPADAVDKVQVYDKKSDRAEFTGVDDGRRQKTLNLELKEDKKQGVFGQATAGYGTEGRYEGRTSLNRFSRKMQLSGLGMLNNTNQAGFSFDDYLNFMGGMQNFGGGGGRVRIEIDNDESGVPLGIQPATGFTATGAGGANLNYEFGKSTRLNASYFYSQIATDLDRANDRQTFLDAGSFRSLENELRQNRHDQHRVNLTLRHQFDSSQNMIFRASLGAQDGRIDSRKDGRTIGLSGLLENDGDQTYGADRRGYLFNTGLTYRRRLGKPGRSLIAELNANGRDNRRDARVEALNRFYGEDGLPFQSDTLRQRQDQADDQLEYAASLSFTEPLGRGQYLEASVAGRNYANDLSKNFYDLFDDGSGTSEQLNPILSNAFRQDYTYGRGGLAYRLNRKKLNLTTGLDLQRSRLDGRADDELQPIGRAFTNLLPSVRFNYDFATTRHLSFDYETGVREPSLEQLQPVVDNTDPLRLYQGNPSLRPEYSHNFLLNFVNFDQFTFTSFFANVNASYNRHTIVNAQSVDSLFRQITQPVNTDRSFQLNGFAGYGMPVKFLRGRLRLETRVNYQRGINFINTVENTTGRLVSTVDLGLENRNKDVFDLGGGLRVAHTRTRYSLSSDLDQTYLTQTWYANATVSLGKFWSIGSTLDYRIYTGSAFDERRELPLWRASLTRYLLKNKRGQLRLTVYDLLDRNTGIRRSSDLNYIEEERIRTLSRYAMLSFTYNLSDFGGGGPRVQVQSFGER